MFQFSKATLFEALHQRQLHIGDKGAVRRNIRIEMGKELVGEASLPQRNVGWEWLPAECGTVDLIGPHASVNDIVESGCWFHASPLGLALLRCLVDVGN